MASLDLQVGDRVKVLLGSKSWISTGWFDGTLVGIDPYSAHRSFYWVELDSEVQSLAGAGTRRIAVLNPKHIMRSHNEPPR